MTSISPHQLEVTRKELNKTQQFINRNHLQLDSCHSRPGRRELLPTSC